MCFRPAGVDMPDPVCPECGKKLQIIGGVIMKKCPFCKADLTKYADQMPGAGAPAAPAAPGAPSAPKAPGAPAAPKAPGA
jgi:hypothetical protein